MADVPQDWSVEGLLRDWRPHPDWRNWFTQAYDLVTRAESAEKRLEGWRIAAVILGDMHACPLCLFVCLHARLLLPPGSPDYFLAHIDLCLWDMGLAAPAQPDALAFGNLGKPESMHRDEEALTRWLKTE